MVVKSVYNALLSLEFLFVKIIKKNKKADYSSWIAYQWMLYMLDASKFIVSYSMMK